MTRATLHGALASAADRHPAATAFVFGDRAATQARATPTDVPDPGASPTGMTYAGLAARVERVRAAVAAMTEPGSRVALVAWNGPWWLDVYFGVPAAGRIAAFVSPRLTSTEVSAALDRIGAELAVVDPTARSADLLDTALDTDTPGNTASAGSGSTRIVGLDDWEREIATADPTANPRAAPATDPAAVAWLAFTSGTTGTPKAAALTHDSILGAIAATTAARPLSPDDVYVYPFPLWHVAGYNVVSRLVAGRTTVMLPGFDADAVIDAVSRERATSISLAATMLDAVVARLTDAPDRIAGLASLREIHYGAAPMPADLIRRFARLADVDFWQGYGMTELSGNAVFLAPADHSSILAEPPPWPLPTGRAAPGVEVAIVDDQGRQLSPGSTGEVVVRGPQVMAGYWDDPAATAEVLTPDGWLHTGDVGSLDASGMLFVFDRIKDIIITGGENVSAREVEEVLRRHRAVLDVAVVAVSDPTWGENVCAVVVPADPLAPLDPHDLREHARAELASFKVPRHVVRHDELPVNVAGKVDKAALRRWLADDPTHLGPRR